jgi:hypothetical protein
MKARLQISMPRDLKRRAQSKAAHVRRLIAQDLGPRKPRRKADISMLFNLCDSGEPTDIARDKDKILGEAVGEEHLRKTGRKPRRPRE